MSFPNLKFFSWLLILFVAEKSGAQNILLDDFNRSNSTTVGSAWVETETVIPSSLSISTNQLKAGSTTSGRDFCVYDVSSVYNTVFNSNTGLMSWAFNIQQSRLDPSGFDLSNYGVAYVLGCNSNNFLTGFGYAVVLGNSGSGDNLRLVKFNAGLASNAGLTNIIAPVVDYGAEFLTVKVTYNPTGNNWSLYVGNNLASFDPPLTATYSQLGATTSDATYTGNDLLYTGTLWNHATSSTDFGIFDNIYVPSTCILAPEPTVQTSALTFSSIGSNAVTLNYTRGNGSECLIIAKQGGPVTAVPADSNSYMASLVFGSGTLMAPNEYVVYSGSANTVTVTGLNPTTMYGFRIFEYNGTGCNSNYLVPSPAASSVTTIVCAVASQPTVQSSGLNISGIGTNTMTLNWIRGNGSSCILIGCANTAVTATPIDASSYMASSIFGIGTAILPGQYALYIGTGNTVTVTGLIPGTAYYFAVFEFNGTGCNTNYLLPGSVSNSTTLSSVTYNFYSGTLHAHSDYSDGDMDNVCNGANSPTCCYDIGNTALNFDYMGISDHNHNEGPVMTTAKYASGISEATTYNSLHSDFVAFYGMEWGTISTGGHINVYGINQLIGWNAGNYNIYCAKGDYNSLLNIVANTPNAFASICHPNDNDISNMKNTPYNITYDNAIVGCAIRSGPYNSTNTAYSNPSFSNYAWYYNSLLSKGYHLGPLNDLDNHNSATMGKSSQQRTVLLAPSLTKNALTDAVLNMRFYCTDDYNMNVSFYANSIFPMGSIVTQTTNPVLTVSVSDANSEPVDSIRIFYGIPGSGILPTLLTAVYNSSTLTYTHNFATGTYYYYAEVKQADGNFAWTAPIWFTKVASPLPVEFISFTGKNRGSQNILKWTTADEQNSMFYTIERSIDGINFESIGYINGSGNCLGMRDYTFVDESFTATLNYYRLRQVDYDGNASYSSVISLRSQGRNPLMVFPNPSSGIFTVNFSNNYAGCNISVYNSAGLLIYTLDQISQQLVTIDLSTQPPGIYLLHVKNADDQWCEKLFIK